jgi:hypothetical protein
MIVVESDVERVLKRCRATLGDPSALTWEGTYRGSLALCIIDAVLSGQEARRSVSWTVERYRRYRAAQDGDAELDGAAELIATFEELAGPIGWAHAIGNFHRLDLQPGLLLKAELIYAAAVALNARGVTSTADLEKALADPIRSAELAAPWREVPGLKHGSSWGYAKMLAGLPAGKPDRQVRHFVERALTVQFNSLTADRVAHLLAEAADASNISEPLLSFAIWNSQRL